MVLVSVAGGPGTAMHGNQHGIGALSFVREQNMELLGFRGVLSAIGNIHIHPAGLAFQRNLTGLGLVVPIANRFSKRMQCCVGMAVGTLGGVIAGLGGSNLVIVGIGIALKCLGSAPACYLILAMLADVIDHVEYKTGIRTDGLTMSIYSSLMVAATPIGGAIIAHEKHTYAILPPEVFHEDAIPSQPMDQEPVTDHLYLIGYEHYYELEETQEGKPWYIPPRNAFLKYADSDYTEKMPQLLAMADYLSNTQRKLRCSPMEIAEEFEMILQMDEPIRYLVEDGQRLGIRFQNEQDFHTFVKLTLDLDHHTRRFDLRGHTPAELGLPQKNVEKAMKEAAYNPHYQDPIANMAEVLRKRIMSAPTVSGKPVKNAPCPCSSGRKYKNCCGKGK